MGFALRYSSRREYTASREDLVQDVEQMRIRLNIPDQEFFKAIGITEEHYKVLIMYRGKGFKLEAIHDMLNGLERFLLNDDRTITLETFKLKYGYHPILLCSLFSEWELSTRVVNCLMDNGISHLGQLLKMHPDNLLALDNFGKKSLREVKNILKEKGMCLPRTRWVGEEKIDMSPLCLENFPVDMEEITRLYISIPRNLYNWNNYGELV